MTAAPSILVPALAVVPGLPANLHWEAPWTLSLLLIPLLLLTFRVRRRPAVVGIRRREIDALGQQLADQQLIHRVVFGDEYLGHDVCLLELAHGHIEHKTERKGRG